MADFDTTDACGDPLPPRCVPGQFLSPICYQVGVGPVLNGSQRITRNADCTISTVEILDVDDQVVPGAVAVSCTDCCDDVGLCTSLQGTPVAVPGPADTALFVGPGGCFLGVPVTGASSCAQIQAVFTPDATPVQVGDEVLVSRAGACLRVPPAAVTFPLLAPDGVCAAPSYSFTTDPTSGIFFDPTSQIQSGGPAVTIGWDSCSSRLDVGTSIRLGADNGDFIEVGASINIIGNLSTTVPSPVTIRAGSGAAPAIVGATVTITAGGATTGAGGDVTIDAGGRTFGGTGGGVTFGGALATGQGGTVDVRGGFGFGALPGGRVTIRGGTSGAGTPGAVEILTGSPAVSRLIVEGAGAWNVGGSVGVLGQALLSNGAATTPTWQTITGFAVSAQVIWGAANIGSAAETRVIPVGYDDTLISTQTPKGYSAPRAGTFRNMYVRTNTANGNGASVSYTLRVNGVATALTVSRATGAIGTSSNLVNTVAVVAGDLIEMLAIKAASIGSGVQEVFVSVEFS